MVNDFCKNWFASLLNLWKDEHEPSLQNKKEKTKFNLYCVYIHSVDSQRKGERFE